MFDNYSIRYDLRNGDKIFFENETIQVTLSIPENEIDVENDELLPLDETIAECYFCYKVNGKYEFRNYCLSFCWDFEDEYPNIELIHNETFPKMMEMAGVKKYTIITPNKYTSFNDYLRIEIRIDEIEKPTVKNPEYKVVRIE